MFSKNITDYRDRTLSDISISLIKRAISGELPCYALGKNQETLALSSSMKLKGIIDDYKKEQISWNGLRLFYSNEIENDAVVFNLSTSIAPLSAGLNLRKRGITNIIDLSELLLYSDNLIPLPQFVVEMRDEIQWRPDAWNALYNSLADKVSRQLMLNLINFRLTADLNYMHGTSISLEEQYFEPFMNYKNEVFVDAGGFDGDTSEAFAIRHSDYRKILFFEPSAVNLDKAKIRLNNIERIEYHNVGLSDSKEVVGFDPGLGSASKINDDSTTKIELVKLDDRIEEDVTFIKMDLEGWETKALAGCRRHIENDKPKLAIAVYHSAADFIDVPELVLSINNDYNIYLRHYTEGWSETIMYFMPK